MVDAVITGHRPGKLPRMWELQKVLTETFQDFNVRRVIQGMADGADLIAAKAAYKMEIPFVAVRPGKWHKPGPGWERDYIFALRLAEKVELVDSENHHYPGPWIFQKRNERMVDMIYPQHNDVVIAVWDGSPSGTRNCINYATGKNHRIWRIDPSTLEGEWLK